MRNKSFEIKKVILDNLWLIGPWEICLATFDTPMGRGWGGLISFNHYDVSEVTFFASGIISEHSFQFQGQGECPSRVVHWLLQDLIKLTALLQI